MNQAHIKNAWLSDLVDALPRNAADDADPRVEEEEDEERESRSKEPLFCGSGGRDAIKRFLFYAEEAEREE